MIQHSDKVSFIWSVADLLRGRYKSHRYSEVILPFTVLRRVDCVLKDTHDDVLQAHRQLKGKLKDMDDYLRKQSGYVFYNTSPYTFETIITDADNIGANMEAYIGGFSQNMLDVLQKFKIYETIAELDTADRLFLVVERFAQIDLHPDVVSNLEMGYIFEELIRKFNESVNENPGEHFTPREVVRLMADLTVGVDEPSLAQTNEPILVYDPCCGTGGMLTEAQDRIREINPRINVHLFGQELSPETYAVCKADLFMKSADGSDAENIAEGSTLADDAHEDKRFDYLLANPPYGTEWKVDRKAVEKEAKRGYAGRFGAGTPRISDGQMLFLQHMIGRMRTRNNGGSRVAVITNGSPLFTGDAGSGETEIRRWVLENDWLEAIIALPEQLFYNTGIATYIWVLTNRKRRERQGKVQLINATSERFWVPMRKSLGDKRREMSPDNIARIVSIYEAFTEGEYCKIFDNADFGYRKVTVERPLRMNFQASADRIARLRDETKFQNIAKSKKRNAEAKAEEEAAGRELQQAIITMLESLPDTLYTSRAEFRKVYKRAAKAQDVKLLKSHRQAIESALGEIDPNAEICRDKHGQPEADSDLRDYEYVPLTDDVAAYFAREVAPHVPDAWIDDSTTDHKDGKIGKVGYEINFNRYFYEYVPPRPLHEIEADIDRLEMETIEALLDLTPQLRTRLLERLQREDA